VRAFEKGVVLKVGYLQFNPSFGLVKENIDFVRKMLSSIEADLIVLPELFNTGYQFVSREEVSDLAEQIPDGFTTEALMKICRDRDIHLVAGLAEKVKGSLFNSAILVGPRGFVGLYRKTHLFAEEKLLFKPGDTGFQVFDVGDARVGLIICFDWFFPESIRSLALRGADIICHCANLVLPYCPDAMLTRCLENKVFAVTANRIGYEQRGCKERLNYIGTSEIVGPQGQVLVRSGANEEDVCIVEIDPAVARDKQINRHNNIFSDRRPPYYEC
jgi:predicted amidohydrolase